MMIKLITAPVARPAMLGVDLDHQAADITMILQLVAEVLYAQGIVLVVPLVVDGLISRVTHRGEVTNRYQKYKSCCLQREQNLHDYQHGGHRLRIYKLSVLVLVDECAAHEKVDGEYLG